MFRIFTDWADWVVTDLMALSMQQPFVRSLHFFIEDTTKILCLLIAMIYLVSFLRADLNVEKIRDILHGKPKFIGYISAAMFGSVTPFCSCSSIPLFLGFTMAKIPIGVTMAFLITSPLVNEVAIVLLGGLLGWRFTLIYVGVGIFIGIVSGCILDALKADRFLKSFISQGEADNSAVSLGEKNTKKLGLKDRKNYAWRETKSIVGRVWKWVLIGVGIGAVLHGYVPENWIVERFGKGQWWSVPSAVLLGIPLYSNATGMIPIMESLLLKGLPVGTTLALSMSAVAVSFPEMVLLKQLMEWKLLMLLLTILFMAFMIVGWTFNIIWSGGII